MTPLANGLFSANRLEESLSVEEATLSTLRRLGAPEDHILAAQSNIATTYQMLRRDEEALSMRRDVYFGYVKLKGNEQLNSLREANNYASLLLRLDRYEEAKSLLRKTLPVARRVLGNNNDLTLKISVVYANVLYMDPSATLDDTREAVTTLEDTERIARRVLGGAHPLTDAVEFRLLESRAALSARETPSGVPK